MRGEQKVHSCKIERTIERRKRKRCVCVWGGGGRAKVACLLCVYPQKNKTIELS